MSADGAVVEQPDPLADYRQRIQMLQAELDAERLRHIAESKRKDEEIERMKKNAVTMQARMEEEEEHITNSLVKRLEALRKEKELLALQVENEEEFMTNTLQKKLAQLRQEKVELENHLEVEQEYIVNKLQKQLLEVTRQKNALERRLNEGRSGLISKLEQSVGEFQESLASDSQKQERDTAQQLELQIKFLREQHTSATAEAEQYRMKCEGLVEKLQALNTEKYKALFEAQMFKEKLEKLQLQREQELVEGELHEEREFNLERRRNRRLSDAAHAAHPLPEEDPGVARLRFRSYSDIQYKSVDDTPRARSASLNSSLRPACLTPPETPSPRDPLSLKRHTEDILKYGVHSTPPHLPSPASMSPSASPLPFGHPYLAEIHRPKPRTGSASLADRRGVETSALLRSASGSSASSSGRGAVAEPRTPKSENE